MADFDFQQSAPTIQELLNSIPGTAEQVTQLQSDVETLRALYEALQQSAPEIIQPSDTWPVASPSEGVIYRVIDRANTPPQYYSDYMWNGTAMVLMATYDNAIDDEPTAGSNNLVKSGGVQKENSKKVSSSQLQDKLIEYDKYKELTGFVSKVGKLYVVDGNNNVIAYIDEKGIYAVSIDESIYIDDFNNGSLTITDKNNNIIAKITKDGIQSVDFIDINGNSILNNSLLLVGKELFTVGDSLSAPGKWQQKVAEITGCTFDQSKNVKPGSQISTGGTASYGGSKDCGLARILNIKKEGYSPDIIMLENVNDANAFNSEGQPTSGTINDEPYIINQILEGYTLSDWNTDAASLLRGIPSNKRMFGTSIQLSYTTSGKNLKILTKASREGDIRLSIGVAQTGVLVYGIHVTTSDTISDIVDKILEYNYTLVTDTMGADGQSVNFSSGMSSYPCSVAFEDTGNTGVTVSITDTDSASAILTKLFNGDNLTTDWDNPAKWGGDTTFFAAWKGMIEFAKINFPAAELILLMFPYCSMNPADYTNDDGTFDQESYNATLVKVEAMFTAQKQIAEIYHIPVIDIHHTCGVTVGNYSQYYYNDNVHPKDSGYEYFGKKIAKELLTIL